MQKTISKEAPFAGVGLHTGAETHLTFKPAEVGSGVVFVRVDLPGKPRLPATIEHVIHKMRRTCLAVEGAEVQTPEHLLAACYGAGIDNLIVEIDGPELPGADGSAQPFYETLVAAGFEKQNGKESVFSLPAAVDVVEEKASLKAERAQKLRLDYHMAHDVSFVPVQEFSVEIDQETFARELAPARTFVLLREAEALKKMGLGKGASVKNTLVIDDEGKIVDNTLRFDDEFVRHKTLDLLGDLFLLGKKLKAHVKAHRSGHTLNASLVRSIKKVMEKGL